MTRRASPARIGVLPVHEQEARSAFQQLGFLPDSVERSEKVVTFIFDQVPDERTHELATAIPFEFYAKRAVVGGWPSEDGSAEKEVKQ